MEDPKDPESFGEETEPFREDPVPPSSEAGSEEDGRETDLWKEKYIRLLADFDNYRKRMTREQEESRKFANESLLKAFLPILDNLERALFHFDKVPSPSPEMKALADGVKLTEKQFLELLEKHHVTRVPSR